MMLVPPNITSETQHSDSQSTSCILATLLDQINRDSTIQAMQPLTCGGNNRAWRFRTAEGDYVAKQYFRHENDARDRLGAEFKFLHYAYSLIPESVPEPITHDPVSGIGIYRFVAGKPLPNTTEISQYRVDQAAKFFVAMNPTHRFESAKELPIASEACFTIADHIAMVTKRMTNLVETTQHEAVLPEVRVFLHQFERRWQAMQEQIVFLANLWHISLSQDLPMEQRCLSPSDFGFHNALVLRNGRAVFLDFEYAGWDDPAKMVGDFFAQIAVPVPVQFFDSFVSQVLVPFPDQQSLKKRIRLLRGVYQFKWCCIVLNVFHPVHLQRRQFANPSVDELNLKKLQLAKAIQILNSIIDFIPHDLH